MRRWTIVIFFILAAGSVIRHFGFGEKMLKPVSELKVRITGSTEIPEPTSIQSTGDWYYLDHISSGLAYYDASKKNFLPMLAESWTEDADGTYLFKLRGDIKFHDGTPITAKDVVWSIKRHLIRKTSTHFPLWEYLVGCDKLKSLDDDCPGLTATSRNEIAFRLKAQTDSFFLQLASPETGIWAAADMDPATASLRPTKFSGPYSVEAHDRDSALLRRNPLSRVSEMFPDSPRAIRIKRVPLANQDEAILKREIDLAVKMHSPLGERKWESSGVATSATTPSIIIYFFGLGTGERPPVGRDLMEALWRNNPDPVLTSSGTFLPFAEKFGLSEQDFLSELPAKTAARLRVMSPEGFFPQEFLAQIQKAAKSVGTEIEISQVPAAEFMAAFNDPKARDKYDYVLSAYAASERYPAVQLRYLTKFLVTPPIDLKKAESPDRAAIFKDYEKWLLRSRQAIPLYFNVMLFVYQSKLDLGEQSKSDAEIELWRVRERSQ